MNKSPSTEHKQGVQLFWGDPCKEGQRLHHVGNEKTESKIPRMMELMNYSGGKVPISDGDA